MHSDAQLVARLRVFLGTKPMAKRETDKLNHKTLLRWVHAHQAAGTTGRDGDGRGLYVQVTPAGRAAFLHKYQWQGKTVERWFPGDFPDTITLADARAMRDADRILLRDGKNPKSATKLATKGVPTFAEYAKAHVDFLAPANPTGRKNWLGMMTVENADGVTVGVLAKMPIDDIEMKDVKGVVAPLWIAMPATAKIMLGRVRRVLKHRQTNDRPQDMTRNPAEFELISNAIGKKLVVEGTPRAALPWKDVPAFLEQLAPRPQVSARALEMVIATGCRVNEITGARWNEINWKDRTLTIPAARMKARKEHIVPLSLMMVRILRQMAQRPHQPTDLIFPNGRGNPFGAKEVLAHVKAIAGDEPTTHGFRSALSDWGLAKPRSFSPALMDKVLAHEIGGVRGAYQRYEWLDERRGVMRQWSRFCTGKASAVVLPFRRAA